MTWASTTGRASEIILNMREKMEEMQHQIEEFVSTLNTEITQRGRPPIADSSHSLIPVLEVRRTRKS